MKILVTGGAGFIGSHFVELAQRQGSSVVVLDALTYAGHRINLESAMQKGKVDLVIGNICDAKLVTKLFQEQQFDAVINFAAESHVDRSISEPTSFIQTNVVGTLTLLNTALDYWKGLPQQKKQSFRFVQVSTDEVFGSLGSEGYFTEDSPIKPNSPYSASKAGGDHLVHAWFHTYGLPTICTHCSNNYGPRQYPEKLIPFMIHKALIGDELPVYGDGLNVRDWIHVEDHCAGIWLALNKGSLGEVYCFGGRAEYKNIDLVQSLCRELDQLVPTKQHKSYIEKIAFVKDRLGHDRRYAIDDKKAEKELGFKRKYNFQQGLKETVRWYVDNQKWCKIVLEEANKV